MLRLTRLGSRLDMPLGPGLPPSGFAGLLRLDIETKMEWERRHWRRGWKSRLGYRVGWLGVESCRSCCPRIRMRGRNGVDRLFTET